MILGKCFSLTIFTIHLILPPDLFGVYHEGDISLNYGYFYILFIINISVAYAFMVLMTFYTTLKTKLKPFEPIGKFLCIKFVIFFAFWQSVVITGMVKLGWIQNLGKKNTSPFLDPSYSLLCLVIW